MMLLTAQLKLLLNLIFALTIRSRYVRSLDYASTWVLGALYCSKFGNL